MDASAWRSRRTAHEQTWVGCRIRIETRDRACEESADIRGAARGNATDVAGVVPLEVRWRRAVAFQHDRPKAWRKAFDLSLYAFRHVDVGAKWHVTVCVAGLLPGRRAGSIELALLADHHERPLGNLTVPG